MSVNVTLVVIGVVLCVIGLAMLGSSQRAGSSLLQKNFGFNIGSTNRQTNTAGNGSGGDKKVKTNWVGLAISVIGFLTAIIGLFNR
jgi:uncharacterized membrane protein